MRRSSKQITSKSDGRPGRSVAYHKIQQMVAPERFSFVENADNVIDYFYKSRMKVNDGMPVRFDIGDISFISVDVLLYLLALMDSVKYSGKEYHIEGNLPRNKECAQFVKGSGFLKHVNSRREFHELAYDEEYLQIVCGESVEGEKAKKIVEFIIKHLDMTREATKGVYTTILELMGNTRDHAYTRKNKKLHAPRWYFMARFHRDRRAVDFAFLDNGQGIPTTVNRRLQEIVRDGIIGMLSSKSTDVDFIMSAISGIEFRSRTGLRNRGKGLPKIRALSMDGSISDLKIISGKGYVSCSPDRKTVLANAFQGTLVSWSFLNSKEVQQ